jgi:hypothetical protein
MDHATRSGRSPELLAALCRQLVDLAKHEEDAAAAEASRTPYWSPCPSSVDGHRLAARLLRERAAGLEAEARSWALAS